MESEAQLFTQYFFLEMRETSCAYSRGLVFEQKTSLCIWTNVLSLDGVVVHDFSVLCLAISSIYRTYYLFLLFLFFQILHCWTCKTSFELKPKCLWPNFFPWKLITHKLSPTVLTMHTLWLIVYFPVITIKVYMFRKGWKKGLIARWRRENLTCLYVGFVTCAAIQRF